LEMWIRIVEQSIYFIILFAFAIFFHEFGHGWYITHKLKRKAKFKIKPFGIVYEDDGTITRHQYYDLYFAGIVAGFIPFFLMARLFSPYYLYSAVILYVIVGCRTDFVNIWRVAREK